FISQKDSSHSIQTLKDSQKSDLNTYRGEMLNQEQLSELSKIQNQFFSDIDETEEFNEALNLYVKPQGKWDVSIIKSVGNKKEMVSEVRNGDVEKVVDGFLESRDKLSSDDLEILANELLNSNDKTSLINKVNSIFASENQLTLEDEAVLDMAANQFLYLNSKNTLKILKIFLKLESMNYLVLKDKEKFENACSKLLDLNAKKILETAVNNILASKCKKVLLILGEGGTGKSTFNRYLARRLWEEYDLSNMTQPIPLFIALAQLKVGMINRNQDFIEIYLEKKYKLSPETIDVLRKRKFVFILDGYDEISERERQCYESNKFNEWKNAKTEIRQYIMKYTEDKQNKGHFQEWDADTYIQTIEKIPQIEEMVSNPILLKITLTVLPDLVKQEGTIDRQINRIVLYDKFFETWFSRAQNRLLNIQLNDKETEA
ncbi:7431_t:CDS:2, partial [Scutellospora calospora]